MISQSPPHTTKHEEFSLPLFAFTVIVTVLGLLAILRFAAPATWDLQFLAPGWKFATAFLGMILLNCFV